MRICVHAYLYIIRPALLPSSMVLAALAASSFFWHAARLPGDEVSTAPTPAPLPMRKASDLFALRCARCHDDDGSGSSRRSTMPALPDFTSARWQQRRSRPQLVVSILEGKGTRMPAFAGRISKGEARALAEYVRTFSPLGAVGAADTPAPEFHDRFRDLQEEFDQLRKQFRNLAGTKD